MQVYTTFMKNGRYTQP